MTKRLAAVFSILLIAAMVLTACGGGGASQPAAEATAAATEAATEAATVEATAEATEAATEEATVEATEAATATEEAAASEATTSTQAGAAQVEVSTEACTPSDTSKLTYLQEALAGKYSGTKVSMMGPFVDADANKFNDSIKDFEEKTGIDIQYEGTKEFEATIGVRVDAGDAPDIVDFPQPGLLARLCRPRQGV